MGGRVRVRGGVRASVVGCRVIYELSYLLEVLGAEVVRMLGLDLVHLLEELVGISRVREGYGGGPRHGQ